MMAEKQLARGKLSFIFVSQSLALAGLGESGICSLCILWEKIEIKKIVNYCISPDIRRAFSDTDFLENTPWLGVIKIKYENNCEEF
jgi:hypothetical protein